MRILKRLKRAKRNKFGDLIHFSQLMEASSVAIGPSVSDGDIYAIAANHHVYLNYAEIRRLAAFLPENLPAKPL